MPPAQPPPSPLLVSRVLWAALLASHGLYAALLLAPGLLPVLPGPPEPALLLALGGAAVGLAVASFVLPRVVSGPAYARSQVALAAERGPSALDPGRLERLFADPEAARREAYRLGFVPLILRLALAEAVSLLGLIAGIQGCAPQLYLPFFGAGVLLTALRLPTDAGFLRPLARARGARV